MCTTHLGRLAVPEDSRRWVSGDFTSERHLTIDADLLVTRCHHERRRRYSKTYSSLTRHRSSHNALTCFETTANIIVGFSFIHDYQKSSLVP